ncbi:hypothetical protein [Luteitalea pratensis]|uniref:hypothetical protein n=1 Tax=Luteitalea pratensis TaxID=1855912 RepID=UPI0012FF9EC8|nr:hypothetical protein [Luteitalea pratensis]
MPSVFTNLFTDFTNNTAAAVGAPIRDAIRADTTVVDELPEDDDPLQSPTFLAVGD